jgi:hypothetical protein
MAEPRPQLPFRSQPLRSSPANPRRPSWRLQIRPLQGMQIQLDRTSPPFQSLGGRVAQVEPEQPLAVPQVAQRAVRAQLAEQAEQAAQLEVPARLAEQLVAQEQVVRAEAFPWQRLDLAHSFNRYLMSHSHPHQQCCA